MSEGSNRPASSPAAGLDSLHCGDCRMPLLPLPQPGKPAQSPWSPQSAELPPGAYYCPGCAKPVDEPLACPHCGSLICPGCGTPLESADDLGIG